MTQALMHLFVSSACRYVQAIAQNLLQVLLLGSARQLTELYVCALMPALWKITAFRSICRNVSMCFW